MTEQRKTIRFEGQGDTAIGPMTLAMQAVPPHVVLVRLEEEGGFRLPMHLEPEHVRMLVKFLKNEFLDKLP